LNKPPHFVDLLLLGDPEQLPPVKTVSSSSTSSSKNTRTSSRTSTGLPGATGDSGNNSKSNTNVGAIVGGKPRNLEFQIMTGSDPAHSTGVVGSIVPLTFLGVGVFLYLRYRRQKEAERQQVQNIDGVDPYKPQRPSMYGPPISPYTPYVSLSCSMRFWDPPLLLLAEPLRSINLPCSEPTKLGDIHHSIQQ